MSEKEEEQIITIPSIIVDEARKRSYQRLRFFGKGGFAKCYEIRDVETNEVYAGKILSKALMNNSRLKQKVAQEIVIHRSLSHKHVVWFHSFFEDSANIYIVLELCKRRSMMELHKRRKTITEPETRYYMHQILEGVQYLHSCLVIHRDLKLGNLFLNDELQVKIGDFGLASKIEYEAEKKHTVCGTPNYIAPEILNRVGHSLESDIWSLGCIMYTLLVGTPPFETLALKATVRRIKECEYRIPATMSRPAGNMIAAQLQANPAKRPSVSKLLQHEFFKTGIMPAALPISCLTTAPRTDQLEHCALYRNPFAEINQNGRETQPKGLKPPQSCHRDLILLRNQLRYLFNSCKVKIHPEVMPDELNDPAAQPLVWVSKWVDYSDKYGFGYQLCDDSAGVMFNDTTKIFMLPNRVNVHYVTRDGQEVYMTLDDYPPEITKKMKLLCYFTKYMSNYLMKAGDTVQVRESDGMARLPHLCQWYRSTMAVIMHLTNGTLQINFSDHTKIILCPLMQAVTYIDLEKKFRTFRFTTLEKHGCEEKLYTNLAYALQKLDSVFSPTKRC